MYAGEEEGGGDVLALQLPCEGYWCTSTGALVVVKLCVKAHKSKIEKSPSLCIAIAKQGIDFYCLVRAAKRDDKYTTGG